MSQGLERFVDAQRDTIDGALRELRSGRIEGRTADDVLGQVDAMKVRSSMTLFHRAEPDDPAFLDVLTTWYGGVPDPLTDGLLGVDVT